MVILIAVPVAMMSFIVVVVARPVSGVARYAHQHSYYNGTYNTEPYNFFHCKCFIKNETDPYMPHVMFHFLCQLL
jgi:hypothetical protein